MFKLLISTYPNPELGRRGTIDHLIGRHTPLVLGASAVTRALRRYRQNIILTPQDGVDLPLLFRRETARHAIIELVFEDAGAMAAMTADRDYLERVRPDERLMADPAAPRIAVATREEVVFGGGGEGGLKVFDLIKRRHGVSEEAFVGAIAEVANTCDRQVVGRRIHNIAIGAEVGAFHGAASHEVIVEQWVMNAPGLVPELAHQRRILAELADEAESWSALTREITVIDQVASPQAAFGK